jgi:hypothetical protein
VVMAKQIGDIKIRGTIAGITFYRMEGQYYARRQSSLTGKRVKSDPRFRRTMASANRLGRGSQLASKVYRSLPRTEQVYALFKELQRMAMAALKEGWSEEAVLFLLEAHVAKGHTEDRIESVGKRKVMRVKCAPLSTKRLLNKGPISPSQKACRWAYKRGRKPYYVLRE